SGVPRLARSVLSCRGDQRSVRARIDRSGQRRQHGEVRGILARSVSGDFRGCRTRDCAPEEQSWAGHVSAVLCLRESSWCQSRSSDRTVGDQETASLMAGISEIEWTEATWNPIAGCVMVSPGCTNCYAQRLAARLQAMGSPKYEGTTRKSGARHVWTGRVNIDLTAFDAPLQWRRPLRIFVKSMS